MKNNTKIIVSAVISFLIVTGMLVASFANESGMTFLHDSLIEELSSDGEEIASDASEPASGIEEASSDAEEPASDAEEPASEAEEPASDAEEPASDAEEPSSGADEPSSADAATTVPDEHASDIVQTVIMGDVNGDGKVYAEDARLALRGSARLEKLSITQLFAADVDGDGVLFAGDARQILRFSAKLQNDFIKK